MEMIQGKFTRSLDAQTLAQRMAGCKHTLIDLGTGDGRFVLDAARLNPLLFCIGVDACRENLAQSSRSAPPNALFVIANAYQLPRELYQLASHVTVHYPWGSLLNGLLAGDASLLAGLRAIMRPQATLEVHLNASALAEAGWSLDTGSQRVWQTLSDEGWRLRPLRRLGATALRSVPTTWARRMAYGRQPAGAVISTIE